MSIQVVSAMGMAPQPWRNGGGATRELLAWPDAQHWQVRISLADITQDGAFSEFAGVQRWFGVVQGAGVALQFGDRLVEQKLYAPALQFDGADAPMCRLLAGATRDVNLMRRGTDPRGALMLAVQQGQAWQCAMPVRALLTTAAGQWTDGVQSRALKAYDFLWSTCSDNLPWRFDATEPSAPQAVAWWLAAMPVQETL